MTLKEARFIYITVSCKNELEASIEHKLGEWERSYIVTKVYSVMHILQSFQVVEVVLGHSGKNGW